MPIAIDLNRIDISEDEISEFYPGLLETLLTDRTRTYYSGSVSHINIGGITNIQKLLNGQGPFAELAEDVFDDYWMNYFNTVDARTAGIGTPRYNNLKTYKEYLKNQGAILGKLK